MTQASELKQNSLFYIENPKYRPDLKGFLFYVTGWKETKGLNEEKTYSVNLRKHKVKGLEGFEFEDNYSQFIEFLNPIPLTEELLLKFGFRKMYGFDNYTGWFKDDVEVECNYNNSNLFNCINVEIKYLHQLQNIYSALTQKEL
jgi:hypothetical protein